MNDTPRLRQQYESADEFEGLLDEAKYNAETDWEETFVADQTSKYERFGMEMYFTDSQKATLERIANGEG